MAVTTKRKTTVKKVATSPKYERLRLREWMIFWILVLANVALVCAIFGNVDVRTLKPVSVVDEEKKSTEQELVDELMEDNANLAAQLETKAGMSQGRQFISGVPAPGSKEECDLVLAASSTETYISHTNNALNVSMSLPYSFAWGNEKYLFQPVVTIGESGAQTLLFGPGVHRNCLVTRDSTLVILNSTSTPSEVRREALDTFNADTVRERTINGMTVLSYRMNTEVAQNNVWIGFGRTFRYQIFSLGWLTDEEAVKIIQSLRVTQ